MSRRRSQGYITLTFMVLLLAMVGTAVAFLMDAGRAGLTTASGQGDGLAPLYLAESGVEYATARYVNGTPCDATMADGTHSVGSGTFEILAVPVPAINGGTGYCDLRVQGVAGQDRRVLDVSLRPGSTEMQLSDTFDDTASYNTNWFEDPAITLDGTSTVGIAPSGYFEIVTNGPGNSPKQVQGYIQRPISAFFTTATSTISVNFDYFKGITGAFVIRHDVSLTLVDSGGGETVLWQDTSQADTGGWTQPTPSPFSVALPAATQFVAVRLNFWLKDKQNRSVSFGLDNLWMDTGGSGGGGSAVAGWSDVVQ